MRAALRSGRPCSNVPLTVLRPDGSTRWLLCSARQLGDVSAVAAGEVLLSLLDLTEQHAAQRDVLASEHRLRVALQSLPDFFAIYVPRRDDSGRVVDLVYDYVNPAALRVLHRPASEVLGRGLVEVLPSNVELGLFDRYVRVLETGETDRFELPWFDEAGVRGAFFITVVRMHDELLIMARDIAEGRQARKEAARSEQRFRAALDAMLDGVVICTAVRDEAGNIVDFTIDYINSFAEVGGRAKEVRPLPTGGRDRRAARARLVPLRRCDRRAAGRGVVRPARDQARRRVHSELSERDRAGA